MENVWVALLTPRLMELIGDLPVPKILVNSELICWIHTEAEVVRNYQAPDMFVCDPVAFVNCTAPIVTDNSAESIKLAAGMRKDTFLFGKCEWLLRDSVLCLLEAKVKIVLNEAIGDCFFKA